jgi:aminopeptidase
MDDMTGLSHASLLDRLAEVAVRVGLGGLNPGQQLVMTAPLEAAALARRITEHAYRAGASLVTTFFADDAASLLRYQHAPDAGFDTAAGWLYEGMAAAFRGGAARLAILGDDPNLLAGQDADKVARANRARSIAYRPALELITNSAINWTIVACATPAWAPRRRGHARCSRRCPRPRRWPGCGARFLRPPASRRMTRSPGGRRTTRR